MKIIKISTENKVSAHEYPKGTSREESNALIKLIGGKCRYYDRLTPKRLYTEFGCVYRPTKTAGESVCMLIDDEGARQDSKLNAVASYLYEFDKNEIPIMGNVLLVGEVVRDDWDGDIDFCGISEDQFKRLYQKLEELAKNIKVQWL